MSRFDWPFTPIHKSSLYFATYVGSVFQNVLPYFQPAHGEITRFRVILHQRESAQLIVFPFEKSFSLRLHLTA